MLERRIVEENLKRQQVESGFGKLIFPPSSPSQHEKWKLARTKTEGQMTSKKSLEISPTYCKFTITCHIFSVTNLSLYIIILTHSIILNKTS